MEKSSAIVSVHPLRSGLFTLPEKFFVTPLSDPDARRTVPSLSFLIQHQNNSNDATPTTRILFDLGLRRDVNLYQPAIRQHVSTRTPLSTSPDVVQSLSSGGLSPEDIDHVILSHVHWDHIGSPSDFPKANFVVGKGSCSLLSGAQKQIGKHSHFEADLLPSGRTIELAEPTRISSSFTAKEPGSISFERPWRAVNIFPNAIDIFDDGSVYIISAPGHLPGHLNLLCRVSVQPAKYIYLAGDSCHDRRLLTGEKQIAQWKEPESSGIICCIHVDKEEALRTLGRIAQVESGAVEGFEDVEVIFAHDDLWAKKAEKEGRFFS
jgi:glyoxylase-like metal-dependent hydrolase (beta-lactamase superfamily II)